MALIARHQDSSRYPEAKKLGRSSKHPPRYRPETYEPLPKKRGYIRVLNLRGSSPENPLVECELVLNRFSKEHDVEQPYEALSWCWGTVKPTAYVNIRKNGKVYRKFVAPDLFAALKALRYPKEDRYLWIDAICINQENAQEKNHQVEIMSEIYNRAGQVCIWLGEGDRSSQMALRFIRKEVLQLQNFDELCESELASEKWSALLDLMQRPWFSRRWVVQEIALARRAVVYCGNDRISWKKFAVAVELFVEVETATHRLSEVMKKDPKFYHVPGWFEYVSALGASLLVEATGKLFRDYKPNDYKSNEPMEAEAESDDESDAGSESPPDSLTTHATDSDTESESDADIPADSVVPFNKGQPLLSLEYLVSSLSIFDVTEPHDAVYALLAIAKDTIPSAGDENARSLLDQTQDALEGFTQKKRYKVDYAQPYSDVCKDFIQFCIEHSDLTRALDIICRPWAPETRKSAPKRAAVGTKRITSTAANGLPKNGRLSVENTDQSGKRKSKDSETQEKAETESSRRKKVKDHVPLPSWIPQLTGAAYAMLPQAGVHTLKMGRKNADTLVGLPSSSQSFQRNYNAAETKGIDLKTFRFQKRVAMKHHSMYVKGFILDTIFELQPSSQGGAIPSGWAKASGWRNVPTSDPPDDFWRTLVADRGRDGKNPPVYYSRACKEAFAKGGLSSGSVNTTDLINNERCSVVAQFCRRVQAVIWNRRLIKTQTGRLGLACQDAQLEDVICILYGCSVPVVLRRKWKTLEQVKQEVDEDVRLCVEKFVASWQKFYMSCKATRLKRAWLRMKWALWEQEMQSMWEGDNEWAVKWDKMALDRKLEQEKADRDDLTQRIKSEKEEMGCFLKLHKESEEAYTERLRRKGFKAWKAEKEVVRTEKGNRWDKPMLNWREFELYLRFGHRWKEEWLRRKELVNAKKKVRSMEKEEQRVRLAAVRNEEQPNGLPIKRRYIRARESDQGCPSPDAQLKEDIDDPHEVVSQVPQVDEPKEYPYVPSSDARTNNPKLSLPLLRKADTNLSDATIKTTPKDDSPGNRFLKTLAEKKIEKFIADPEKGLQQPEQAINPYDSEDMQRLKENWCYYEVLGECYVHGMMDGEAMAYQNKKGIRAQVFELR